MCIAGLPIHTNTLATKYILNFHFRLFYSTSHSIFDFISYYIFLFLFQALLFYIPRWLWKNWEAGKVAALRMDLNLGIISDVEKKLKKKLLIDYLYSNLKHHNFWAYRYFFCEFLALLNVTGTSALTKSMQNKTKTRRTCRKTLPRIAAHAVKHCSHRNSNYLLNCFKQFYI